MHPLQIIVRAVDSYQSFSQNRMVEMVSHEGLRGIPYFELKIFNIIAGLAIITVLALFLNHEKIALALLTFSLFLLVIGFLKEHLMITRTDYRPLPPRDYESNIYRIGHLVVFFLNVVVLLIYWFPLPSLGADAEFGEIITTLLLYAGFPALVLYYDFERMGKALAQGKYANSVLD